MQCWSVLAAALRGACASADVPRRCRGLTEDVTACAVRMADALLWESGGAVESQPLVAIGEIDDAAV